MKLFRNAIIALLILGPFNLQLIAQDPGFFLDDWQEKTAELPDFEEMTKPAGDAEVTITADVNQVLRKVPKYVYGNNAVSWDNEIRFNATAMKDLNNLNPHVLRFPGGNLSNNYFWNLSDGDRPDDIPANIDIWEGMNTGSWQMGVDDYYALLEETNSEGQICVNYSYARYGTGPDPVATAAHMAAEWVRYDKGRTKFWEIGNEDFGNWQAGYEIDVSLNKDGQPRYISGNLYGEHCKVFMDSMRTAAAETGADIKIGVVAYDAETSWDPISEVWNEKMMPVVGDLADFLVVHNYYTPYDEDSPVSTILNSYSRTAEFMDVMESDMAEAGKLMLPVAMTEWNIFAVGSMQAVSYINGMHAALLLGEFIKQGYGMSNRWDLVNGWDNGNDMGLFSSGGEPGVDSYNPRPAFFYMYYFQKYFGDRMIQCSDNRGSSIIPYASSFSSGETGFVIVNKGSSEKTAEIVIQNLVPGYRYYTMTLTGGSDNGDFSRKVLLNGNATDEEGGGPDTYESIKASSAMTTGGIKVKLPPLSVVYVLVDKNVPLEYVSSFIETNPSVINLEVSQELGAIEDPTGFEIIVNGDSPAGIVDIVVNEDTPNTLEIYLDTEIQNNDELSISYSGTGIRSVTGSALGHFSGETVENLLPEVYYTVALVTLNSGSGLPVSGCNISFNFEEQTTTEDGSAVFSAASGSYVVDASGLYLSPVENLSLEISSDTLIEIEMDSAVYQVSFHVINEMNGLSLPDIEIVSGSTVNTTGSDGNVYLEMTHGTYDFEFTGEGFFTQSTGFEINSDTAFEVGLAPTHVSVKFRLRNGTQPVNNALVILGSDSLYTSPVGVCTFSGVEVGTDYAYTAEKELYIKQTGSINVSRDTTLNIQIEKSVASIDFEIEASIAGVNIMGVVIDEDTAWCNEDGETRFINYPRFESYDYQVISENFPDHTGNLYLENDTVVTILLEPNGIKEDFNNEILLYPNPAKDRLVIESTETSIREITIWDLKGRIILQKEFNTRHLSLNLDDYIPAGSYIMGINTGDSVVIRQFIVER